MRAILKRLADTPLFSIGIRGLRYCDSEPPNLLRVLTYHRVVEPSDSTCLYRGSISATPAQFAGHIEQLAKRFQFADIGQVIAAQLGGAPLPPRAILLTFDDAYRDFQIHAWPVLRERKIPVVLFVPTSYPSNPKNMFWWDRLASIIQAIPQGQVIETAVGQWPTNTTSERQAAVRALRFHIKSLPDNRVNEFLNELTKQVCIKVGDDTGRSAPDNFVLSWDELRDLASQGVTLAPHTQTHPLLNRIPFEQARTEVAQSLADLRREIGEVPAVFAYPSGAVNDQVARMVHEEGFCMAFTTQRGINQLPCSDPMRIRRINVGLNTSPSLLELQLFARTRWFHRLWN